MGLLDSLGGIAKNAWQQEKGEIEGAALQQFLAHTQVGDLGGLAEKLRAGGLGTEVQSWLGNGANLPVTADQIQAALGNSRVQDIARSMGIPVDTLLPILAQQLPTLIDKLSANGQLNTPST